MFIKLIFMNKFTIRKLKKTDIRSYINPSNDATG